MDDQNEPRVRLEPAVGEDWIRRVVLAGHSPNDFASWVLQASNLDELIERYASGREGRPRFETNARRVARADSEPELSPSSKLVRSGPISVEGWSKKRFIDYLDLIVSVDDMAPSARLLGAYLILGPTPSSQDLQELCGFEDETEWQTALRVAKQRLTIYARRMDCPSLFRRAKAGKEEGQRLHPIEPVLFGWLKDWGSERTNTDRPERAFPEPERWGWESVDVPEEEKGN